MEIRQLEYFLAIVHEGTVTAAAASLHVAQPTLSQALRRLERELGTPLFDRSSRRMRATAAGQALYGPAQRIIRECSNAQDAVGAVRGLSGGHIDIVTLPELSAEPLGALIGMFRDIYPLVEIRVATPTENQSISSLVEEGACDIGIGLDEKLDPGVMSHHLDEQHFCVVAAEGTLSTDEPALLADVAELPFICTGQGTLGHTALYKLFSSAGLTPRIAVTAGWTDLIVPIVQAGGGVALMPEASVKNLANNGLSIYPLDPPVTEQISLMHRRNSLSPAAKAFIGMAVQRRLTNLLPK